MPTRRKSKSMQRSSRSHSVARKRNRQRRIDAIRKRFVQGRINLKKMPTEMKSRVQGKVQNAVQIETDALRAHIWQDAGGKKMVLSRTSNPEDQDVSFSEHVETLVFSRINSINEGIPTRLVIELGENDSRDSILNELNDIDPDLAERVEFVGGVSSKTYSDWRKQLEQGSNDRSSSAEYLKILSLLDAAIQSENKTPVTPETLQSQINLIKQLGLQIPLATSTKKGKKDIRNKALEELQKKLGAQEQKLRQDRIQLLRTREQEIRGLGVAKRTPSEVLVHFLYKIRKQQKNKADSKALKKLERQVRRTILQHNMTLSRTQKILKDANKALKKANHTELAELATTLQSHLPETDDALAPTRLHDNVYGRVLDSAVVSGLVADPPDKVKASMQQAAKAMASYLRDDKVSDAVRHKIALDMQEYLNDKDPRFWLPLVPSLKDLADADSPEAASKALLDFLDNPGNEGAAVIAIPYMVIKTANIMQNQLKLDWMDKAGKNYWGVITKQTGRTDSPLLLDPSDPNNRLTEVQHQPSEGAGITLRHQTNPFKEDAMVPSMRPTLRNMPAFEQDIDFPTESAETALTHGLPFASGVSGSTNIMLHLLDHMRSQGEQVDTKNFLLGAMMFLVYDGGHSIQEVLWTANQLDKKLNLGLDLGDPDQANEFVADYQRFVAIYDQDGTKPVLTSTLDRAVETTLNYFAENSVYSDQQSVDADETKTRKDKLTLAKKESLAAVTGNESQENNPPAADLEIGDLLHPNPALYFRDNDQGGENYRVDSQNPGQGWSRVEQFCSILASHWLSKTPGEQLAFSSLADQDRRSAINTLRAQSGDGLAAQVQHAETVLAGTSVSKKTVRNVLSGTGYPPGTRIWFANDRHAQAALVLEGGRYQVYDPDLGTPVILSKSKFRNYIKSNNAFVVSQLLPSREAPSGRKNQVAKTLSPRAVIPLAIPTERSASSEIETPDSASLLPELPVDETDRPLADVFE